MRHHSNSQIGGGSLGSETASATQGATGHTQMQLRSRDGERGSSNSAASVADEADVESAVAEKRSPDHVDHTAARRRSSLFLHDSEGASVPSRLHALRGYLAFIAITPQIGLVLVGALMMDHAPSYLMNWATLPVQLLSYTFLSVVTIVSQVQLDPFFIGTHGLWWFLVVLDHGLYLWRELGWLYGLGFDVYCVCGMAWSYIMFARMREALRCAHAVSLQGFLEGVFLLYAEFMVIASYGTVSSVSCLLSVDVGDSGDLLDSTMWSECGATVLSNICLGIVGCRLFLGPFVHR